MFKNALVSTSDKNGLVEFLRPLVAQGCRIVSTGGTSKHLRDHKIPVVEVAEQTGFPEVMDGRVRTLHPSIHMPLLARLHNPEDVELLKKNKLEAFDLVIVNLYPFADALKKNLPEDELIEFIDIGGPSLLRAASKNFDRIAVVCDPSDYKWILEKRELNFDDKKKLAAKVFAHTAGYDAMIANALTKSLETQSHQSFISCGELTQELRYGENPQQKAWWYKTQGAEKGIQNAKILHGKALSYNNLLDIEAASRMAREFSENVVVAVKHNSPCGIATNKDTTETVRLALSADPVSVFGGIVACNFEIDEKASELFSKIFLECIVAPGFSKTALEQLTKKKDLRLLEWDLKSDTNFEIRSLSGGFLVQAPDQIEEWNSNWKVLGTEPNAQQKADLVLAWRACANLKSNAIAIAANNQTIGLGMGQVNRVDAVEQAISRAQKNHGRQMLNAVLASDAFFPFADSMDLINEAKIRWVIQPGGSIRDQEVLDRAAKYGINLVLTGKRHFRH